MTCQPRLPDGDNRRPGSSASLIVPSPHFRYAICLELRRFSTNFWGYLLPCTVDYCPDVLTPGGEDLHPRTFVLHINCPTVAGHRDNVCSRISSSVTSIVPRCACSQGVVVWSIIDLSPPGGNRSLSLAHGVRVICDAKSLETSPIVSMRSGCGFELYPEPLSLSYPVLPGCLLYLLGVSLGLD